MGPTKSKRVMPGYTRAKTFIDILLSGAPQNPCRLRRRIHFSSLLHTVFVTSRVRGVMRPSEWAKDWRAPACTNCCSGDLHCGLLVLVMTAPPKARLVAPFGSAVEPVVHAKE